MCWIWKEEEETTMLRWLEKPRLKKDHSCTVKNLQEELSLLFDVSSLILVIHRSTSTSPHRLIFEKWIPSVFSRDRCSSGFFVCVWGIILYTQADEKTILISYQPTSSRNACTC